VAVFDCGSDVHVRRRAQLKVPGADCKVEKASDMKRILFVVLSIAMATPLAAASGPTAYIEAAATVDGSNSRDKAKQVDFGSAIAAALLKKEVPVTVVTDQAKAKWTIKSMSSQREDSTGTKVAKLAFAGAFAGGFTKFEGTVQVIDNETSAIVYAYNVKKGNFQSAAEAFAKHFKDDFLKK
jgi:hypothetical protein